MATLALRRAVNVERLVLLRRARTRTDPRPDVRAAVTRPVCATPLRVGPHRRVRIIVKVV